MDFVKQRDDWRCGPVSMLNLFISKGYDFTYKDLNWITGLVDCNKTDGTIITKNSEFVSVLAANFDFLHLNTREVAKWKCIDHLQNPEAVFLANHKIAKNMYHIFLVNKFENNYFSCINYSNYEKISKLTWKELSAGRTLETWLIK